ncbi:MAG: hypothetical protein ACU0GG_08240 [Paracoccaceae bacterium]
MSKRGRKSAAELAIAPVIEVVPRPAAPDHLSDDEARIWEDAVSSMVADYFRRSDFDTLANMCRHVVAARDVTAWINRALADEDTDISDIDRLLKMRERETRAANALARSLRLTKQAQYSAKGAHGKGAPAGAKPWEMDNGS